MTIYKGRYKFTSVDLYNLDFKRADKEFDDKMYYLALRSFVMTLLCTAIGVFIGWLIMTFTTYDSEVKAIVLLWGFGVFCVCTAVLILFGEGIALLIKIVRIKRGYQSLTVRILQKKDWYYIIPTDLDGAQGSRLFYFPIMCSSIDDNYETILFIDSITYFTHKECDVITVYYPKAALKYDWDSLGESIGNTSRIKWHYVKDEIMNSNRLVKF